MWIVSMINYVDVRMKIVLFMIMVVQKQFLKNYKAIPIPFMEIKICYFIMHILNDVVDMDYISINIHLQLKTLFEFHFFFFFDAKRIKQRINFEILLDKLDFVLFSNSRFFAKWLPREEDRRPFVYLMLMERLQRLDK